MEHTNPKKKIIGHVESDLEYKQRVQAINDLEKDEIVGHVESDLEYKQRVQAINKVKLEQ